MSFRTLLSCSRATFLNAKSVIVSTVRKGHYPSDSGVYRNDAPPVTYGPRIKLRNAFHIFIWWHIFYSFWYDPEIMLGHPQYEIPNAELWSDEELGIPPDDYDEEI